jgi:hypothetical protein
MAAEPYIPSEYLSLMVAATILIIYSSLYKYNQWFSILEKLIVGITIGQAFYANLNSVYSGQILPLVGGNTVLLLSVIIGGLYLCVLYRPLIGVYRAIMIVTAGAQLSQGIPGMMKSDFLSIQTYAQKALTNVNDFILLIVFVLAIFYFIYGAVFDRGGFRELRSIGRYAVFMCQGLMFGPEFFRYMNVVIGWFINIMSGPGVYLIPVAGAVILLDALGFLEGLKASTPAAT